MGVRVMDHCCESATAVWLRVVLLPLQEACVSGSGTSSYVGASAASLDGFVRVCGRNVCLDQYASMQCQG